MLVRPHFSITMNLINLIFHQFYDIGIRFTQAPTGTGHLQKDSQELILETARNMVDNLTSIVFCHLVDHHHILSIFFV